MADITAIILTRNEEDYIEECISSIKQITKRIFIVDSFSEDNTVEIAKKAGAEVVQHKFENHAKQYMYAVKAADVNTKWILKIDADERLTKESAEELEALCEKNMDTEINGIVLRFCNIMMGKKLKHGGLYPWRKLSLYKTDLGEIENRNMDEHIVLKRGKTINAQKDSIHLFFRNFTFFVDKYNWYATKEAMDFCEAKRVTRKNANFKTIIKMNIYYKLPMGLRAWLYYFYRYYIRLGFLDGREGKMYAFMHAYWYRFLVDVKIYEHDKRGVEFESIGALKNR